MLKLPYQKRLKTIFTFFLFLSLFGLFPHCSLTGPEEEKCYNQKQNVFNPDAPGSWWKYQMWYGDMDRIDDTLRLSVTGNYSLDFEGETYDTHTLGYDYESGDYRFLKWNGPDGYYKMGGISANDTFLIKALSYKYPVSPGESWLVPRIRANDNNIFYIHDSLTVTCIDTHSLVITEIDTFITILYETEVPPEPDILIPEIISDYFEPGIGLIKSELKSKRFQTVKGRILLYDYCLKK